jgi:hypothetical protein
MLKAHGHPGIPLHRAEANQYLCKTCVYDADDTCTYPQRPYATECTLYRDRLRKSTPPPTAPTWPWRYWLQKNLVWLVLVGIILLAIFLALGSR